MTDFVTKDSGERASFSGGMVRDTNTGKVRPDLVRDGPMLLRWIMLMTRGAQKYAARNWTLANDQAAIDRYLESADRHFLVWFAWRKFGINLEDPTNPTKKPLTEDHAAGVFFNINGAEYVNEKMATPGPPIVPTKRQHRTIMPEAPREYAEWHDVRPTCLDGKGLEAADYRDEYRTVPA